MRCTAEGRPFVCKRYVLEIDRWDWFAQFYIGDEWFVWQSYTLPAVIELALAQIMRINAGLQK